MILVKPSFEIISHTIDPERLIEAAGRTCYKSERNADDAQGAFAARLIQSGHMSVIEHMNVTVRIICDRGVSHELVRHRLASYSQESTRYCNYSQGRFGGQCTFVIPPWYPELIPGEYGRTAIAITGPAGEPMFTNDENPAAEAWMDAMMDADARYRSLIAHGETPQQARSVLPNSLKTEVVMTANAREWRHVFALRCSKAAHPQMREIMIPMRDHLAGKWPAVFGDLAKETEE